MTEQKLITKDIAIKLHDALMEHHDFSDYHELASHETAIKIIADAGLGSILLPLRPTARSRKWDMHVAVIGAEPGTRFRLEGDPDKPATRVYGYFLIQPMIEYVGELATVNLTKAWWADCGFFRMLASLLAPGYGKLEKNNPPGRAHWGDHARNAFEQRFREIWLDGEHEPRPLEPAVEISPKRLRFSTFPVLPWPPAVDYKAELQALLDTARTYGPASQSPDKDARPWEWREGLERAEKALAQEVA